MYGNVALWIRTQGSPTEFLAFGPAFLLTLVATAVCFRRDRSYTRLQPLILCVLVIGMFNTFTPVTSFVYGRLGDVAYYLPPRDVLDNVLFRYPLPQMACGLALQFRWGKSNPWYSFLSKSPYTGKHPEPGCCTPFSLVASFLFMGAWTFIALVDQACVHDSNVFSSIIVALFVLFLYVKYLILVGMQLGAQVYNKTLRKKSSGKNLIDRFSHFVVFAMGCRSALMVLSWFARQTGEDFSHEEWYFWIDLVCLFIHLYGMPVVAITMSLGSRQEQVPNKDGWKNTSEKSCGMDDTEDPSVFPEECSAVVVEGIMNQPPPAYSE